jgi:cysteine synthase B
LSDIMEGKMLVRTQALETIVKPPDLLTWAQHQTATVVAQGPAFSIDLIGNTPLLRLNRIADDLAPGVELYAKPEWYNPGGSIKDRAAWGMIRAGEESGALAPGKVILDATSGNTGIAYAWIGAARGYQVKLALPANASIERQRILRAYGADLLLTDPSQGTDGAIRAVKQIYAEDPDLYFYPDQYNNPANWLAHYDGTGLEIWHQTAGRVTHFVAGLGTSGTFVGTGRRLRDMNPEVRLISVQPTSSKHGLAGLKHMASAIVPGIYDPLLADEDASVETEEALAMVRRLAREEGLLVGISSGAALVAALQVAREQTEGVVVTLFPDGGDKYLSESFWEDGE